MIKFGASNGMEGLRTQIVDSRVKNSDGRHFVPNPTVIDLVTAIPVRKALKECNVVSQDMDELVQTIIEGARTVFAVLILIRQVQRSSYFVRNDQFQSPLVPVDHKLPFGLEALEQILEPMAAKEFFERQWEFTAPNFSRRLLPRSLTKDTILPILEDRLIGAGGFGEAHEIRIHPYHFNYSDVVGQTVRHLYNPRKGYQGLADIETI